MAERLGTAELLLTADPKPLQAGLRQAEQSAQQSTQKIGQLFQRTGGQARDTADEIGKIAKGGGGIPPLAGNIANLAAQLGLAVSAAEVLRYTFNQLTQIEDAGAAVRTLGVDSEQLRGKLADLSDELGANVSTLDLMKASYDVASSGFADAASATDILRAAAAGARGGFADINEVAKATTAVLNAYGLSSSEATRVVDGFVQAQADGVLTVKQYADNIGEIVSVAAAAGISIEELNAAIATATLKGVQVNQAFTGFRQVISSILKPSAEATKLANQLGIDFSLAGLQAKGFSGFLQDVALKTGASADKVAILLGSVEAQAALQPLLNDQLAKYNELLGKQATKTGAAAKSADTASATISSGITKITNRLSNLAIELDQTVGNELDDIISAAEKALGLLERLARARPENKEIKPPKVANIPGSEGVTGIAINAPGALMGDPKAWLRIAKAFSVAFQPIQRAFVRPFIRREEPKPQQEQKEPPARFPTSTAAESDAFFARVKAEQAADAARVAAMVRLTTASRDQLEILIRTRGLQDAQLARAQDLLAVESARRDAARARIEYENASTSDDPKKQAEAANALAEAQARVGIAIEEATRKASERLKEAAALVKSSAEALRSAKEGFAGAVGQAFAIATNEQRARARAINEERIRAAERAGAFDPARVANRYGLGNTGGQLQLQSLTFRQLERLAGEVSTLANAEKSLQSAMNENTTALKALAARKWEVRVDVRQNAGGDVAVNTINNLR
jgi:TP901 family phage tail tape measure protein